MNNEKDKKKITPKQAQEIQKQKQKLVKSNQMVRK